MQHSTTRRFLRYRRALVILLTCGIFAALTLGAFGSRAHAEDPTAAADHSDTPAASDHPATAATGDHSAETPAVTTPTLPTTTTGTTAADIATHASDPANAGFVKDHFVLPQLPPGELLENHLTPENLHVLKVLAAEQIRKYLPAVLDKLDEKYYATQEKRLFWLAIILMGVLPALGFIGFMLVPVIRAKKIRERVPNAPMGRLYRLYLLQAGIAYGVLIALGALLVAVQFIVGQAGRYTNPQLAMQENAIYYVVDHADNLVDDYADLFINVANDLNDPDSDTLAVIVKNAEKVRNDPVIHFAYNVYNVASPFIGYIFWAALALVIVLYFVRILPDVALMARYPVEVIAAEQEGRPVPSFEALYSDTKDPTQTVSGSSTGAMRINALRLGWIEFRVVGIFAVALLVLAVVMSLMLSFFYVTIGGLFVEILGDALSYFLSAPVSSTLITSVLILMMVFVIESIVLFVAAFAMLTSKVQVALRTRFQRKITWAQSLRMVRRNVVRFLWVGVVIAVLSTVLAFADERLADYLSDLADKNNDDNFYLYAILATPVVLLVGLNLLCWLLRVFKTLMKIITSKVDQDALNLPPPPKKPKGKAKQEEAQPVAV